jgi:hypothetical protein
LFPIFFAERFILPSLQSIFKLFFILKTMATTAVFAGKKLMTTFLLTYAAPFAPAPTILNDKVQLTKR